MQRAMQQGGKRLLQARKELTVLISAGLFLIDGLGQRARVTVEVITQVAHAQHVEQGQQHTLHLTTLGRE